MSSCFTGGKISTTGGILVCTSYLHSYISSIFYLNDQTHMKISNNTCHSLAVAVEDPAPPGCVFQTIQHTRAICTSISHTASPATHSPRRLIWSLLGQGWAFISTVWCYSYIACLSQWITLCKQIILFILANEPFIYSSSIWLPRCRRQLSKT